MKRCSAKRDLQNAGKVPENNGKSAQRSDLLQNADQEPQRQGDELVDIVLNSLLRIIHVALHDLKAVVSLVV